MAAADNGDEAKAADDVTIELRRVQPDMVAQGDLVVCLERYLVHSHGAHRTNLKTLERGDFSTVDDAILGKEFYGVRAQGDPKKVTRTHMVKVLRGLPPGLPVTIVFRKKQTQKRATDAMLGALEGHTQSMIDALQAHLDVLGPDARVGDIDLAVVQPGGVDWSAAATAPNKRKRRRLAANPAKEVQAGELRRMTGFPKGVDEAAGRMMMEEVVMEGDRKGQTQDRTADLRTLEELVAGGVKYMLK